ncbi:hypothetical protein D3C78_752360 [compost metagenome]
MGIVSAVLEGGPMLATVFGAQDQVEHTNHKANLVVGEPDVEQRLVGALLDQTLAIGSQLRPLFVGRLGAGQRTVMLDQQVADLAAVQLFAPGHAGIAAVQHHAIAADRPALLGRREVHAIEVRADRNPGLRPLLAGIIGIKDVASLSHSHQALTCAGRVQQGAAHRQGTGPGWQIQHVDIAGRLGDAQPHCKRGTQCQHHALLE